MIRTILIILFLITVLDAMPTDAQPIPREYVCYRTDVPLVIDGKLDEKAWQHAPWTTAFVDIEGSSKPAPYFETRAKMLWDSDFLYIAAELEEPHLWVTYDQRDSVIFHENDFEVFIDPDGDTHQYYELEINALGTVWDLLLIKPYRDGGPAVDAWDIAGLKSSVALDGTLNDGSDVDKGWTVELALPWNVLEECAQRGEKPRDGDQWRINFSRVQWRTDWRDGRYVKQVDPESGEALAEHNWVWSPQGVINMHCPEHWGFVQFSDFVAGQGHVDFVRKPEEQTKLQLRQLYYAQAKYKNNYGRYAEQMEDLLPLVEDKPDIDAKFLSADDQTYFIAAPCPTGQGLWVIREDGKVSMRDD